MTAKEKFINFLESIKTEKNSNLIENVVKGFNACLESGPERTFTSDIKDVTPMSVGTPSNEVSKFYTRIHDVIDWAYDNHKKNEALAKTSTIQKIQYLARDFSEIYRDVFVKLNNAVKGKSERGPERTFISDNKAVTPISVGTPSKEVQRFFTQIYDVIDWAYDNHKKTKALAESSPVIPEIREWALDVSQLYLDVFSKLNKAVSNSE